MSCKDIQVLISAKVDGELRDEEYSQLEEHLSKCTECQQYHDKLKLISGIFLDAPEAKPPKDLVGDILKLTTETAKIIEFPEKEKKSNSFTINWKQLAAGIAIFFISLSVGIIPLLTHKLALDSPFELIDYSFQESFEKDEVDNIEASIMKTRSMEVKEAGPVEENMQNNEVMGHSNKSKVETDDNNIMQFSLDINSKEEDYEANKEQDLIEVVGQSNILIALSGSILGMFLIIKTKK